MATAAATRERLGRGGRMREGNSLSTPRPGHMATKPHNPVRTGVMSRAHGGPVRTVHPVHTGSSEGFFSFGQEGRGWG